MKKTIKLAMKDEIKLARLKEIQDYMIEHGYNPETIHNFVMDKIETERMRVGLTWLIAFILLSAGFLAVLLTNSQ